MELIEHKRFATLSTWHEACSLRRRTCVWQNRCDEENPPRLSRRRRGASQRSGFAAECDPAAGAALGSESGAVSGVDGPAGRSAKTDGNPNSAAIQHFAAERVDAWQYGSAAHPADDHPCVSPADGAIAGRILERESRGPADFSDPAFQPADLRKLEGGPSGAALRHDHYGPCGFSSTFLD